MLRVGVALVSTPFSLGLIEGYLRLARPGSVDVLHSAAFTRVSVRPGQMTELIPGATKGHFIGGAVRIHELGFRGVDVATAKSPGT